MEDRCDLSIMNTVISQARVDLVARKKQENKESGDANQRRGNFWGLQAGFGKGQGNQDPVQFRQSGAVKHAMEAVITNPAFQRLAKYQAGKSDLFLHTSNL